MPPELAAQLEHSPRTEEERTMFRGFYRECVFTDPELLEQGEFTIYDQLYLYGQVNDQTRDSWNEQSYFVKDHQMWLVLRGSSELDYARDDGLILMATDGTDVAIWRMESYGGVLRGITDSRPMEAKMRFSRINYDEEGEPMSKDYAYLTLRSDGNIEFRSNMGCGQVKEKPVLRVVVNPDIVQPVEEYANHVPVHAA